MIKNANEGIEPPIDIIPAVFGAKAFKQINEETIEFIAGREQFKTSRTADKLPRITGAGAQFTADVDNWNMLIKHIEALEDRITELEKK